MRNTQYRVQLKGFKWDHSSYIRLRRGDSYGRDCNECQFGFHIIAHELNHLKLNSLKESFVEKETLNQTRNRLIPLLLSNPTMCKGCFFAWPRMYSEATFKCMMKRQLEKKE